MSYLTYPLVGGLGNQLFIIAAAFHMKTVVSITLVLLKHVEQNAHSTKWDNFYDNCPILEGVLVTTLPNANWVCYGKTRFSSDFVDRSRLIEENKIRGISTINEGYFQHLQYLPDRIFVRELFNISFKQHQIKSKLRDIDPEVTCAIHFRLGDYKGISNVFLLLPDSYYHNAIEIVLSQRPNIKTILVFNEVEDQKIVQFRMKNINNSCEIKYSTSLHLQDWEEMIAMSLCSGIVIANSTFSWWAAYFSQDATVVYPPYWHHDQGELPEHSLSLPGWIKGH